MLLIIIVFNVATMIPLLHTTHYLLFLLLFALCLEVCDIVALRYCALKYSPFPFPIFAFCLGLLSYLLVFSLRLRLRLFLFLLGLELEIVLSHTEAVTAHVETARLTQHM